MSDFEFAILLLGVGFILGLLAGTSISAPVPERDKSSPSNKRQKGPQRGRQTPRQKRASPFIDTPTYSQYGGWSRYAEDDYIECEVCLGKGRLYSGETCPHCDGTGYRRVR